MNAGSRALLRIARWLAGRQRADWVDAMAAETELAGGNQIGWAAGCLWAAAKDRCARDWWFIAAIILVPLCTWTFRLKVFFWTSSLLIGGKISPTFAVACWIMSYAPAAFLFSLWRRGKSAHVALALSFCIIEAIPIVTFLSFGIPLSTLLANEWNWYKADPGVKIGPLPGLTLDALVWFGAAWLAELTRKRPSPTG